MIPDKLAPLVFPIPCCTGPHDEAVILEKPPLGIFIYLKKYGVNSLLK